MRYELKNSMKTSSRKQLKYKYDLNTEDDDPAQQTDIRDVEFRINHDSDALEVRNKFICCLILRI